MVPVSSIRVTSRQGFTACSPAPQADIRSSQHHPRPQQTKLALTPKRTVHAEKKGNKRYESIGTWPTPFLDRVEMAHTQDPHPVHNLSALCASGSPLAALATHEVAHMYHPTPFPPGSDLRPALSAVPHADGLDANDPKWDKGGT